MCDDLKFSVMSSLFSNIQRSKSFVEKRIKFRKFFELFCKPGDYFSAMRLLLPSFDRERGSYGLQESVLATCLIDALGMARDSPDAVRLINWRKGGAKTGANAGNFSSVAAEILQRRQGMTSGGLSIKELNELLDRLASSENRAEKTSILGELIQKTNSQEMKWIIMILLKDLKLGVGDKSIFHIFHPDAEDLFNVTCDLRIVCEKLSDRSQRHKRQDIEVGKAVRPQKTWRVDNAAMAWKTLHGKEVVVECKFDGERIQIHKNGSDIHFFSRNFIDHTEYADAMSKIIMENILVDRCILDGELLVWDRAANRFAEFGSNQELAKAAGKGLANDRQLCYVAFDILYDGDTSVIHLSLKERHKLLQKVVKSLKNRFEILVPNAGLNIDRPSGEPCWSLIARDVSDVERFFKETVENRAEGVVLKDLGSKWEPDDRSKWKWLKLKPDYIRAGSDLDVLIIGGYYGSGRHGGEVAQFLVGLAEKPTPNTYPRKFISFCRVGTGLSDEELEELVSKLKPYFRKYEYPKKTAPNFYQVTNNSKERPDVWIENPEKSVILSITSDIRTMRSEVFAAPYSLRFPRIDRIRYDKPWHECLDIHSFVELVNSSNGTTQRTVDHDGLQDDKPKRRKPSKRGDKNKFSLVPSHFIQTDVSNVKGQTSIFSGLVFYFVNVPPKFSLDSLHKMVIENGGTFSMNLSDAVTHSIAAESKGIKYEAAKRRGDVIHSSWFLDCCSTNKLIRLQPKYFLFLSDTLRKRLQDEIDEFSDSYFSDLNVDEFKQILGSMNGSEDARKIGYYKRKYCPSNKWARFHGCCIFFHIIAPNASKDWEDILKMSLGRMKAELLVGGGRVSQILSRATHVVVLLTPEYDMDFQRLLESFSDTEKHVLYKKRLLIVRSKWFEDSLNEDQKLPEAPYSLKSDSLDESTLGEHYDDDSDTSSCHTKEEKPPSPIPDNKKDQPSLLPNRSPGKKRGRPVGAGTRKRKIDVIQPRKTRPRIANRPAKLDAGDFDTTLSDDENKDKNETECARSKEVDMVEDLDLSSKKEGAKNEEDETATGDEELKLSSHIDAVGPAARKRKTDIIQPRRTRPRIANRSAKLDAGDFDTSLSDDGNKDRDGTECAKPKEVDMVEDLDLPPENEGAKTEEDQTAAGNKECKLSSHMDAECSKAEDDNGKKDLVGLGVMDDPVHSLLLNMIPSLGGIKEAKATTSQCKGKEEDVSSVPEPVSAPDPKPGPEPGKKKKVSYKDLADKLLNDW